MIIAKTRAKPRVLCPAKRHTLFTAQNIITQTKRIRYEKNYSILRYKNILEDVVKNNINSTHVLKLFESINQIVDSLAKICINNLLVYSLISKPPMIPLIKASLNDNITGTFDNNFGSCPNFNTISFRLSSTIEK